MHSQGGRYLAVALKEEPTDVLLETFLLVLREPLDSRTSITFVSIGLQMLEDCLGCVGAPGPDST